MKDDAVATDYEFFLDRPRHHHANHARKAGPSQSEFDCSCLRPDPGLAERTTVQDGCHKRLPKIRILTFARIQDSAQVAESGTEVARKPIKK